jgi:hypothetical protein
MSIDNTRSFTCVILRVRLKFLNVKKNLDIANVFSRRKKIKLCRNWPDITRSTWKVQKWLG